MYKLIAIDLDGTLLNHEGKVSPENKRAVRRALEAGLLVCFATGRNYNESKAVIDEIGHYAAAVFVGGATVIDTGGGEVLHRQLMEADLAAAVCAILVEHGLPLIVMQDRDLAGVDFAYAGPVEPPPVVRDWHGRHNATARRIEDLADLDHAHTMRVSTLGPAAAIEAAERDIGVRFAERLFHYRVMLAQTGVELLEVFDPSVNKWAGIEMVMQRHGIAREEVIAIGDDFNDLHMIENAGLGVAMGNARDEVKAIAGRVIGSHAEDGLAAFLDEIVDALA